MTHLNKYSEESCSYHKLLSLPEEHRMVVDGDLQFLEEGDLVGSRLSLVLALNAEGLQALWSIRMAPGDHVVVCPLEVVQQAVEGQVVWVSGDQALPKAWEGGKEPKMPSQDSPRGKKESGFPEPEGPLFL